jgi:hypothetical protein
MWLAVLDVNLHFFLVEANLVILPEPRRHGFLENLV